MSFCSAGFHSADFIGIRDETESGGYDDLRLRISSEACVAASHLIVKRYLLVGNDLEFEGRLSGAAELVGERLSGRRHSGRRSHGEHECSEVESIWK